MDDNETQSMPEPKEPAPTYKLKLEGGGITLDREVEEEVAFQIVTVVMGGGPTVPSGRGFEKPRSSGGVAGRGVALREFLDQVEAKRNPDKIVAMAIYLEDQRGIEEFEPGDIKKEFKAAKETIPANFARDFRSAVQAGWIAPVPDEPGMHYATDTGRKAVEAKFSSEVRKARPARRRSQKKASE